MTERRRIFRFAVVGTGVAAYHLSAYLTLLYLFGSTWVANLLAFCSAVVLQYIGQTAWTFGKPLAVPVQVGRFLCMIGVGLTVSSFITGVAGPELELSHVVTAALVVTILPVLNFIILSLWVFRERTSL